MSRWLGSRAGAGLTAVVTMAAAGAVWAMVAIVARQPVPWMAVPMAAAAVLTTGSLDLGARWSRGLCAGLLAAGGTAYALGLATIERLARMLGRGFFETALTAGPEMIAALAWARLDDLGQALVLAGPCLAAAWASWRCGRGGGADRPPAA